MKTEGTRRLEKAIWDATNRHGVFGCLEVTIGWHGNERVDYMTYDTKGTFRCYEVKVTNADFHSRCNNSFVGHLNYYVMPSGLYEEVRGEIPGHVGVYVERGKFLYSVKRAKRRTVGDPDKLKDSMIRSLCREATKQVRSGDPSAMERKDRELSQVRRERDGYRCKYWDLLREVRERYGVRWNKGPAGSQEQEGKE
jgi:hypothetical protein